MSLENLPNLPAWRDEDRDFLSLTYSYFAALSILLERTFRYRWSRSAEAEMLFDPVMYLYRHAIECGLKYFLYSRPVNLPKEGHVLHGLYIDLQPYIIGVDQTVLKPLEEAVDWYKEFDTNSGEAYRYPFGRGRTPYEEKIRDINNVDIKGVYESMKGVQNAFLHIAHHLGGEDAAENFIFHDEFEEFNVYDVMEEKNGKEGRYE